MILIRQCRVLDPATNTDEIMDLTIKDGLLTSMEKTSSEPSEGSVHDPSDFLRVIPASGLAAAPGLVDVHVHFRDPGFTNKEDISSGSEAAARGGFTTVVCMANTRPPVDNPETLSYVLKKASESKTNVKTVAAVSLNFSEIELTDMALLKELGAVGFSNDGMPITDTAFLLKAMEAVKKLDVPISVHEEDPALIYENGINSGIAADRLGLKGAPSVSESSMIARDAMLALYTGAKVHFQHLSCTASVEAVRMAKHLGASVTAEITPSHFPLTEDAISQYGALAKVNPPLRTEKDRQALIEGLKDGAIDMIATDHAPHSADEKALPFAKAPSGIMGLETALALGITHLVKPGHLTLMQLIEKMSSSPARLYDLSAGRLELGKPADIVLFDPEEVWTPSEYASKSSNSPFTGQTLTGRVKITICGGRIVYEDGV
jgi:dihydroorotase